MDTDAVSEASTSVICDNNSGLGADEQDSTSRASGDVANCSEVITRLELDLARASEKLVNLSVLMMHIDTKESEFEAFASENDYMFDDSVEKASEIDLLAGFLDSEVDGVDGFLGRIQIDIFHAHEMIPFCKFSKETSMYLEEKFKDSEESLKQSHELISDIRMQSAKLQKNLRCYYNGNDARSTDSHENNQMLERNPVIDMRTAEHQMHILRMLEKSLAREMDLEKKLTETSQMDDELKLRLHSSQQDVYSLEEELEDICGRCFEAENSSEALKGILKEVLGRLQVLQFNVNGSMQREAELKLKYEGSMEQLKAEELEDVCGRCFEAENSSEALKGILKEVLGRLQVLQFNVNGSMQREAELKLKYEGSMEQLKAEELEDVCGRCFEAENSSEVFIGISKELLGRLQLLQFNVNGSMKREDELKLKCESSMEQLKAKDCELLKCKNINAELKSTLHSQTDGLQSKLREAEEKLLVANLEAATLEAKILAKQLKESEEIEALKRQLRESDMQLQQAVASGEASQEKQNMLYATINDMENLIRDLKLKVVKADSRANRAEENCILLSESYAELNEELRLVRGKLGCLETSLQQAEYRKKASAKDIDVRTKVITNLVMQLAIERDRLHKQLSFLAMENKMLEVKLQQANQDSAVTNDSKTVETKNIAFTQDLTTAAATPYAREIEVDETKFSAAGHGDDVSIGGSSTANSGATESDLETTRRIDAGVLSFKHIFLILPVVIIIVAIYLSTLED